MPDVDYQRAGLVRQLLAERENVVAYGNEPRVKEIDRQLADLGYEAEKPVKVEKDEPPKSRATKQASQRHTTAKGEDE
jgi:hypothetical protein